MTRIVIVPQDSDVLRHDSTETLHTYENGDRLVRTTAPLAESGQSIEISVRQGLQLPTAIATQQSITQPQTTHKFQTTHSSNPLAALHATSPQSIAKDTTEEPGSNNSTRVINAYIELIGPIDARWLHRLTELGIELLQYHPENSYLSQASKTAFQQALAEPFVLNVLPLTQELKPRTIVPETGEKEIWVIVRGNRDHAQEIIQQLSALEDVLIRPSQDIDVVDFYLRLRATITATGQDALLAHPLILGIEPYEPPQPEGEVAGLIVAGQYDTAGKPRGSYLRWLEDQGINGEGVTIGIVDAGVDTSHPAFGDRIKDLSGKKSWHGTFVAGHAAGCYLSECDRNQFIYGLGIAPKAYLLAQDNSRSATALCKETVTESVGGGSTGSIQNNSWGAGTTNPMNYASQEATYDKLVRSADPDSPIPKPLTICFSAGNSGTAGLTRPKAAKNIIVTGNSETYRPEVGREQSDNIYEVYTGPRASSHGNCGDGRIVPHLVAPGEWTSAANYDSHPGQREYISAKLTWGGGSSAASPKTAGACALLTQWWRRYNNGNTPSPAMLKALLVNGAVPMQTGGPIPNPIQGWGRLNLENIFTETIRRIHVDQSILLTQRGEQKTWNIRVVDPQQPVKMTLCWTDPPAALGTGNAESSAIVNKLALRAEANGSLYRANQFHNGWSYPEGSRDREGWDNLQNIFLPAGAATSVIHVSVTALDLTTNCLTGRITPPQQDFALIISNGVLNQGSTSATVVVAVDRPTQPTSPPKRPDEFWVNQHPRTTPSTYDQTELAQDWWQAIHQSAKTPFKNSVVTQSSADFWWSQDEVWWATAETEREDLTPENPQRLNQSIQAGLAIIAGGRHQGLLVNEPPQPEGDRSNPITSTSFSAILTQLMEDWTQLGVTLSPEQPLQRRAAVLVVRAGTRIQPTDLAIMRQLTLTGDLYLVSDNALILTFLAQRIHRCTGVHLRLAYSTRQLESLVQDTLIEASGGQRVDVSKVPEVTAEAIFHHLFQVVQADRHLTLRIHHPPNQRPQLKLHRPDQVLIELNADPVLPHVKWMQGPDFVQVDLTPTEQGWSGEWNLMLQQSEPLDLSRVQVWAWGNLQWQIRKLNTSVQSETEREHDQMLVTLSSPDSALYRLQGQPRILSNGPVALEAARIIDSRAEAPRQPQNGLVAESQQASHAPELSALIEMPRSVEGTAAVDLPLRVEGIDSQGNRFTRLLRHTVIQLEPRSQWRQRLEQQNSFIFTPAQLLKIHYGTDETVELTVHWGDRQRQVQVLSSQLRQQLKYFLKYSNSEQVFILGAVGAEVYGIYQPLSPTGAKAAIPHFTLPLGEEYHVNP